MRTAFAAGLVAWFVVVFFIVVLFSTLGRGDDLVKPTCPPQRPHMLLLDAFTCDLVGHWPGRRCRVRPNVMVLCLSNADMQRARK